MAISYMLYFSYHVFAAHDIDNNLSEISIIKPNNSLKQKDYYQIEQFQKDTQLKEILSTIILDNSFCTIDEVEEITNGLFYAFEIIPEDIKQTHYYTFLNRTYLFLLLISMMEVESSFSINVISKANAVGLLQILPSKENLAYINSKLVDMVITHDNLLIAKYNITASLTLIDHFISINEKTILGYSTMSLYDKTNHMLDRYLGAANSKYKQKIWNRFIQYHNTYKRLFLI